MSTLTTLTTISPDCIEALQYYSTVTHITCWGNRIHHKSVKFNAFQQVFYCTVHRHTPASDLDFKAPRCTSWCSSHMDLFSCAFMPHGLSEHIRTLCSLGHESSNSALSYCKSTAHAGVTEGFVNFQLNSNTHLKNNLSCPTYGVNTVQNCNVTWLCSKDGLDLIAAERCWVS